MQKLTNLLGRRSWRGTALVAHAPSNFWPGTVGPGSKGTIYPPAIIWQNYKQNNLLLLLVSQPDCHTFYCLCWQYRKQKNKNRQSITVVSFQFLDIPTALTFLGPKCANCATKTRAVFLFLFFFLLREKGVMGSNPVLSRAGESLSEAFILASINPKHDDKLFVELQFCTCTVQIFAWIWSHHLHLQWKFKLWVSWLEV